MAPFDVRLAEADVTDKIVIRQVCGGENQRPDLTGIVTFLCL